MRIESIPVACSHCGSHDLAIGVQMAQNAEVGRIGLHYKDGLLLCGTEALLADLCTACGQVQRFYVRNPNHKWLTYSDNTQLVASDTPSPMAVSPGSRN